MSRLIFIFVNFVYIPENNMIKDSYFAYKGERRAAKTIGRAIIEKNNQKL